MRRHQPRTPYPGTCMDQLYLYHRTHAHTACPAIGDVSPLTVEVAGSLPVCHSSTILCQVIPGNDLDLLFSIRSDSAVLSMQATRATPAHARCSAGLLRVRPIFFFEAIHLLDSLWKYGGQCAERRMWTSGLGHSMPRNSKYEVRRNCTAATRRAEVSARFPSMRTRRRQTDRAAPNRAIIDLMSKLCNQA